MIIFLSYASSQRPIAEDLCHRLQAAGHEVFFDREDLPPGRSYDDHIFQAIGACELFVFLVTPESVADGRYTRTELKIASRRWPNPGWHVLPVLAAPTPMASVPSYLRALNLLQPEGNLAAEVLLEVQDRIAANASPAAAAPDASSTAAPESGVDAGPPVYGSLLLRFDRLDDGRYRVDMTPARGAATASGGAAGEVASTNAAQGTLAALTIDASALGQRLWQGAVAVEGPVRRGLPADAPPAMLPGAAGVRDAGTALHALLFGSVLGPALRERLRAVDPQRGAGLRLVLDTTATPELARLPWELLYSPEQEDFVFSDRLKPLVRRLSLDVAPPVLAVAPPLRLLVVVATPADRPELQVGDELAHLERALATLTDEGRLQIERLSHATLERLDDALLRWRPHMLHFIGHGDFDGDEGRLLLESDAASQHTAPIAGRQLAVLLRNHLGSLRLVFLNSCLGAAAAQHSAFGGVAQSLVRRGVPAVVAMQFPVPDAQAVTLAHHFYRYVAAGQPVDAALTSARAFMVARGDEVCWAAPVLYLNAEDGRLFDIGPLPPRRSAPASTVEPTVAAAGSAAARPAPDAGAPEPARRAVRLAWIGWLALLLAVALGAWYLVRMLGQAAPQAGASPDVAGPAAPAPQPVPVAPAPPLPPPPPPPPVESIVEPQPPPAMRPTPPGGSGAGPRAPPTSGPREPESSVAKDAESKEAATRVGELSRNIEELRRATGVPTTAAQAGTAYGPADGGWAIRVRPGDTLWGLAERFAGEGRRWPELWRAHQARAAQDRAVPLPDPNRLRAGQPVWIPVSERGDGPGLTVRVAPGDSLWRIAERVYGDGRRWPLIQRANALPRPDRIVPGQVLRIDPAP